MSFVARTARTARVAALASTRTLSRTYATEAPTSGGLRLNFALPHQAHYKQAEVQQVNLPATSGDMGILANHVASIEQLKPGVLEVFENPTTTKKFFVSGGFATIHNDSSLDINAVEAFPLEDFSIEAVRSNLAEAQRIVSSGSTEEEKAAARIEVEVYEALQAALGKG